ncbi:hypothetical protein LWI28_014038 [Acer negundo]|uniref:Protein kinase domain-containing protein n=1 Tax=Acer negundo TaxID=4023 RepID=A0AAD5IQ54_ACENE|nr:hypothetical protein LWI28_014038 [Acer negundo]
MKLIGSASISQHLKGFIQIPDPSPTVDHAYQAGRAIYSSPIRFFDPLTVTPASFQTTFSFQFTTNKSSSPGNNGMAFVIVPDEFTVGRPGPWLGIVNDACSHYKVVAIEFDSSHDPKFGDPNDDHVGINLGSVVSFKTANISSSSESETNSWNSLHDHDSIHRAWIIATKRFSKMEVLASDSRGVLYRGTLPNGSHVSVKRFSTEFLMINLNWTQVLKRISSITQVSYHHYPGLAPIRGWCCDNNRETFLVYDYYQNGSLERWLIGLGVLPWTRRFKLVKDIAEALCFLHSKKPLMEI